MGKNKPQPQEYPQPKSKRGFYIFLIIVGVIIGLIVGYSLKKPPVVSNTRSIRDETSDYTFIKPLLLVDSTTNTPSPMYQPLYNSVKSFIKKQSSPGDDTSVYFIDYGQGGRFVINENDLYSPASLMKVVVMIAYFKKAETDPDLLNSSMVYQANMQAALDDIQFSAPSTLVVGQSYTVSDLINQMIENSDNGAMTILISNIGYSYLANIYSALGFKGPTATDVNYKISASDYSLFFRVLYNATYLSDNYSEEALSILSKATFNQGITAPLPKGTVVAHKFGVRVYSPSETSGSSSEGLELHDCGIVYLPNNPYFLCVMTHGSSLSALESRIQGISSLVYNSVVANKQN